MSDAIGSFANDQRMAQLTLIYHAPQSRSSTSA